MGENVKFGQVEHGVLDESKKKLEEAQKIEAKAKTAADLLFRAFSTVLICAILGAFSVAQTFFFWFLEKEFGGFSGAGLDFQFTALFNLLILFAIAFCGAIGLFSSWRMKFLQRFARRKRLLSAKLFDTARELRAGELRQRKRTAEDDRQIRQECSEKSYQKDSKALKRPGGTSGRAKES